MKLKELNTTLENQRTICYKKDGNSITYHNKDMRLVEGCLYCGEPEAESQWNSYCMLYVRYPDQKVARLSQVTVTPEGTVNVRFWKTKNGKCSEKVFDCLFELVRIVRAENQKETQK